MILPILLASVKKDQPNWGISGMSQVGLGKTLQNPETNPLRSRTLTFSATGESVYTGDYKVSNSSNATARIFQYNLSTPWDITTASTTPDIVYDASSDVSVAPSSFIEAFVSIGISADGTKMLAAYNADKKIYEFTLSTPYNVSTATFVKSVNINDGLALSLAPTPVVRFSFDGSYYLLYGQPTSTPVAKVVLNSPWAASIDALSSDTAYSVPTGTSGISLMDWTISANGTKTYLLLASTDVDGDNVYFWDGVNPANDIPNFVSSNSATEETTVTSAAFTIFVKPNGGRIYIGSSTGPVTQYDLT